MEEGDITGDLAIVSEWVIALALFLSQAYNSESLSDFLTKHVSDLLQYLSDIVTSSGHSQKIVIGR